MPTNEMIGWAVVLVAVLGTGSVIGIALKTILDNRMSASTSHIDGFTLGRQSRDTEVDGLRQSFEARFSAMEARMAKQQAALVTMLGWVNDEHREKAVALLIELGTPETP